jgi:hypothetical protein
MPLKLHECASDLAAKVACPLLNVLASILIGQRVVHAYETRAVGTNVRGSVV